MKKTINLKKMAGVVSNNDYKNEKDHLKNHRYRIDKKEAIMTCDRCLVYGDIEYNPIIQNNSSTGKYKLGFNLCRVGEDRNGNEIEVRYNTIVLNNLDLPYTISGLKKAIYLMSKQDYNINIIEEGGVE